MPPSPALRCSPGRELRGENHKRGHSFETGLILREKDDDLALFSDMQTREKDNFLVQSSDDFEDTFSTKLRYFSDLKLGISVPARGESSDLLNADGEKNDYDWLLTPPDTPLFPSLDDETTSTTVAHRGRPRSQPITISRSSTMEKSYRSSRGSASPHRLSPSPRSGNGSFQSRGRPSSAPNSSPAPSLRHTTPTRRPSPPPSKSSTPAPRSSTPTPRRMSTGSSSTVASYGVRGTSPVKTSRGNSASPKIRAWQSNIPGFSSEAPPNLRTSLADRPASYVRGSSPASRNGRDSSSNVRRQSMSPTASRSSSYSHDRDRFSSHSKGSVVSSGDDDIDSLQSVPMGSSDRSGSRRVGPFLNNRAPAFSKKPTKTLSSISAPKRSFDSAIRQMDHRRSPQNMFRPLLSSVPSTTFYAGKTNSAHRTLISRNSSVTTSSNASSDQGTSVALDTEESEQNQDDVASEGEKAPYPDVQDEVFILDKVDVVNEGIGHKISVESHQSEHSNFDQGLAVESDHGDAYNLSFHDTAMTTSATSEALHVKGVVLEFDNLENILVCSQCGGRYHAIEPVEREIKLCPDCRMKDNLLIVSTPVTKTIVSDNSPAPSMKILEEYKPFDQMEPQMAVSELPETTDMGETQIFPCEENVRQGQTCHGVQSQSHVPENSPARSLEEEGEQRLGNQQVMAQPDVGYHTPDGNTSSQQLRHLNDYPNLKVDISEGAGISVLLLKRSSSSKGPVLQGRTFTATTISYDDPSYARDITNSMRSSIGHGSASASSSVDLGSAKHMETRVQRQLSGRKSDMENYKYDPNTKPQITSSPFSAVSSHASQASGLAMSTHEDNFEVSAGNRQYGVVVERPVASQGQVLASENAEVNDWNSSFSGTSGLEEDNFDCNESCRTADASTSELLSHALSNQVQDSSAASFPSCENCLSYENSEDFPNNSRSTPDIEESVGTTESCFGEEHTISNTGVDGGPQEVPTHSSLVTISEIEIENGHQSTPDSQIDAVYSKGAVDDFQEPSVSASLDKDLTALVPEPNTSDHAHGMLEESTIVVEGHGRNRSRSLTLDEATDRILFCSSIVHNLAYQAATIAMEKENVVPLEGSRPTVTLLGKSNPDRKEAHGRSAGKRSSKSQKSRQRRVETDAKLPLTNTESDEKNDESLPRIVGLPDKVDSTKPPKLESKCNCAIM